MNEKIKILSFIIFLLVLIPLEGSSQNLEFKGVAAGWSTSGNSGEWAFQSGLRYIPEMEFFIPFKDKFSIEGEFSANLAGSYTNPTPEDNFYGKIKPYRMWMKFSGNQFEIRAGLQKINFGSAMMLRPLMWFDQIDPRDPLQLTDGVYGILGRYYSLNNLNIWLWGLYGNKNRKGWESMESDNKRPEIGGRIQIPVPRAEIGLSYHNREAILPAGLSGNIEDLLFPENRFGIDFKVDVGIGLWVEDVVKYQDHDWDYPYTNMLTIGADYTFGLGNGFNITIEHLNYSISNELLGKDISVNFTGLSARYPLSMVVNINAIIYYDWGSNELYRFLNMGLTYDKFSYYFMGFWNPQRFKIFDFDNGPSLFNGAGLQLMVVYNH